MTDPTLIARALAARYPDAAFSVAEDGAIHWQTDPPADWDEADLPALLDAAARQILRQQLAARRYAVETGGIIWNGWPVHTDRDAQAKITAAYVAAQSGLWPSACAPWKFADGVLRDLTPEQVISMAQAVFAHVQAAYATERARLTEIDATGTTDIEAGWP